MSAASEPVTLRAARPEDAADVLRINRDGSPGVTLFEPGELELLASAAACYAVAEAGARVAAYVLAIPSSATYVGDEFRWFQSRLPPPFVYIDQVAVAPEWRGRGIGSLLYSFVEDSATRAGVGLLACEVNLSPPNPGSARFHDRHGFAQIGTLATSDGRLVSLRQKRL